MEMLDKLFDLVEDGENEEAIKMAEVMLDKGVSPQTIIGAMTDGMRKLGDLFDKKEIFLPELLIASDALMDVMSIVEPKLSIGDQAKKKTVIMGTVAGDLHEIGKNLVCMVLKANGYNVIDIGGDVSVQDFISAAEKEQADVIGMSALMTTTMRVQQDVINQLVAENKRDKYTVMVGGAPINQDWAEKIGADGYCKDAFEVVKFLDSK
ncbi:MAG: cobalamin-binding protein [Firmicutes bacterium]|nr:cobalamin-binding protein [Bacillota bacterium]